MARLDETTVYTALLPEHKESFVVLTDTHLVDPAVSHAGTNG